MKLSIKKLLVKILQAIQTPTMPYARMVHGSDNYLKDARTWKSLNTFTPWRHTNRWNINGKSYTYAADQVLGDDYFQVDINGFKFMQSGWYLLAVDVHYHMGEAGKACALRLYNYTQGAQWASNLEYQSTPQTWGHLSLTNIVQIKAGDIVIPQIQKYTNDTTTTYRMSTVNYEAVLLRAD